MLLPPRYSYSAESLVPLTENQESARQAIISKFKDEKYHMLSRSCAICGRRDFELIAEKDRYGLPVSTVICTFCGLVQTNPLMREKCYEDFYVNHYRELYSGSKYGEEAFFEFQVRRGKTIIKFLKKHIPNPGLPKPSLILEVGCGTGGILQAFKGIGHNTIGVDYDKDYLEYGIAKGLDLRDGDIHKITLKDRPNLIIYSHVLEHVHDLHKEIERIKEILKNDGFLYVEVPGIKNMRSRCGWDFLKYLQNAHLYHFSSKTLEWLFNEHDFRSLINNEYVRAIYKKGSKGLDSSSEYESTKKFILKTEKLRPFISPIFKVKDKFVETAVHILKDTILYKPVRYLYRTFRR